LPDLSTAGDRALLKVPKGSYAFSFLKLPFYVHNSLLK